MDSTQMVSFGFLMFAWGVVVTKLFAPRCKLPHKPEHARSGDIAAIGFYQTASGVLEDLVRNRFSPSDGQPRGYTANVVFDDYTNMDVSILDSAAEETGLFGVMRVQQFSDEEGRNIGEPFLIDPYGEWPQARRVLSIAFY